MKKYYLLLACFFFTALLFSQKQKADSPNALLAVEKTDTGRVILMWNWASVTNIYDPGAALITAQQALLLAREIGYMEGESRTLGVLGNTFIKIGNYPKALEYYIQKLKLEEERHNPRNMASVMINIGVVYVLQEEYRKALEYYRNADSVIIQNNVEELKYYSLLNIGDAYDRLEITDSAFIFFGKSLVLANELQDGDFIGTSLIGLGHCYFKKENDQEALEQYKKALPYLEAANDEDLICEAALGIAKVYDKRQLYDSAEYYARLSLDIAEKDGFQSRQLDAAEFLSNHYKKLKKIASAFTYLEQAKDLKDSISSKDRIRESQIISSNEQFRQLEIAENKKMAKKERDKRLQLMLVGLSIPFLFLFTVFLSRIKIHETLVKFLGVISLLILFEYLILLLHPYVEEITHHTPVYELLIFVLLASALIPTHHRMEHWLIGKLTRRHGRRAVS